MIAIRYGDKEMLASIEPGLMQNQCKGWVGSIEHNGKVVVTFDSRDLLYINPCAKRIYAAYKRAIKQGFPEHVRLSYGGIQ